MTITNKRHVCSDVLDLFVYWQISGKIMGESLFDHNVQHCETGSLFKHVLNRVMAALHHPNLAFEF